MATIKLNNVSIATETAGAAALTVPSIQQTDAQNISGTKASHEMFMGKTFTLTGDLTVNDNLVFANLTGGGADITITDDGNGRTITTGSAGTLEAGEFLGTVPPPTDISTMTSGAITSGVTFPAGHVLQVVQETYTGHTTVASASYQDILTANITLISTSSKVLINFLVNTGMTGGNEGAHIRIERDGTSLLMGDARGSRDRAFTHSGSHYSGHEQYGASGIYLDSPTSISSLTYTISVRGHGSGYPVHINSNENDGDASQQSATASVIILTEIGG